MFFSTHYAGISLGISLAKGELWKKVFGPVFIYLNSVEDENPLELWADAKEQVIPQFHTCNFRTHTEVQKCILCITILTILIFRCL